MGRSKTVYECSTCGDQVPKWVGRCGGCGNWNTLVESVIGGAAPGSEVSGNGPAGMAVFAVTRRAAVPLDQLDALACEPLGTGIEEFDRVLGGGLVPGSITLVGGEPGVDKTAE